MKQGKGSFLGYAGVAGALFLATGCDLPDDTPDAQYGAVCVDQATQARLDDEACGDYDDEGHSSSPGVFYMWYPMGSPYYIPPVGSRVVTGSGSTGAGAVATVPKGTPIAKGVPKAGGTASSVQRGGFGIKSGSTSGTGSKSGSALGGGGKGASSGS